MKTLNYVDASIADANLLSTTAFDSKKYWGYSDDLLELWKPELVITPGYICENKVVKVFDDLKFVGFFAIKLQDGKAELDHLWITAENINRGYGRLIFKHIAKILTDLGVGCFTLVAEPGASGFYSKMGGSVVGQFQSKVPGRILAIFEFQVNCVKDE